MARDREPHEYTLEDLEGGDLKNEMQRLRKGPMHFAFGIDDERVPVMLIHRTRKAQTLRKDLKSKLGVNKPTYGTARANGKVIELELDGARVPQMEKLMKELLRKHSIGTFSKALVVEPGQASASEGEDDDSSSDPLVEELRREQAELEAMEKKVGRTLRNLAEGKRADRRVLERYVEGSVRFAKRSRGADDRELKSSAKDFVERSKKTAKIVKRIDRGADGAGGTST
jgi:hypothetical protein